jgi:hypothetical protein
MNNTLPATFIGFQETSGGPKVAFVNVNQPFGVSTEVYNRYRHEISNVHEYVDALCEEVKEMARQYGVKVKITRYK